MPVVDDRVATANGDQWQSPGPRIGNIDRDVAQVRPEPEPAKCRGEVIGLAQETDDNDERSHNLRKRAARNRHELDAGEREQNMPGLVNAQIDRCEDVRGGRIDGQTETKIGHGRQQRGPGPPPAVAAPQGHLVAECGGKAGPPLTHVVFPHCAHSSASRLGLATVTVAPHRRDVAPHTRGAAKLESSPQKWEHEHWTGKPMPPGRFALPARAESRHPWRRPGPPAADPGLLPASMAANAHFAHPCAWGPPTPGVVGMSFRTVQPTRLVQAGDTVNTSYAYSWRPA